MSTFYVSNSGSGSGVGSPGDPFTRDQAAVRAAGYAGDTLLFEIGVTHQANVNWTATGAYRAIGDVSNPVTIRSNVSGITLFKTLAPYCEAGGFKLDGNGASGIAFYTDDNLGPASYVHDMWVTNYVGASGVGQARLSAAYARGDRLKFTNCTASNAGQLYLAENRQPALLNNLEMIGCTSDVANLYSGGGILKGLIFGGCSGAAIAIIESGSASTTGLVENVSLYNSGSINIANTRNRVTVFRNILAYRPSTQITLFANAWGTGTPTHLSDLAENVYYGGGGYSGLGLTSGTITASNVNVITADPFVDAANGDFSLNPYGRSLRYAQSVPPQAAYTNYRFPGAVGVGEQGFIARNAFGDVPTQTGAFG